jgi:hypothetical protein
MKGNYKMKFILKCDRMDGFVLIDKYYLSELDDCMLYAMDITGQLLAVTASELIQCLSYPELEMEKIFELEMEAGWYAIWEDGIEKIMYDKIDAPNFPIHNILL